MTARERYIEALPTLSDRDLIEQLERGVVQNSYGSHDEQNSLVRAELMRRMAR